MAVVPRGTAVLAEHLQNMGDDDSPFRMDDYHLSMALNIILNPQAHVDALSLAGINVTLVESADFQP